MPKNNSHSGGSTPADGKDQDRSGTMSKTDKDRRKSSGHGGKSGREESNSGGRARNQPPAKEDS
jgi:hypothetical protein